MKYELLKIGTDAEVFLKNEKGGSVPVVGLLGGTKQEPKPVVELGKGFAVQEDNVMAEFNVPAASSAKEFIYDINKMMAYLKGHFAKQKLRIAIDSCRDFSPEQLESDQAKTFGCEPDLCVWTRSENEVAKDSDFTKKFRTAAAHIHVSLNIDGHSPTSVFEVENVVKAMDLFLGVPSVLLDPEGLDRRQLYGKWGAFRMKSYGVEYRTLSNFWIKSPQMIQWVFESTQKAINWLNSGAPCELLFNSYEKHIDNSINHGLNKYAKALCKDMQFINPETGQVSW